MTLTVPPPAPLTVTLKPGSDQWSIFRTVSDWIIDSNTCFLIGAGCSICAGKPAINTLTDIIKAALSRESLDLLNNLQSPSLRTATVEDLINYLLSLKKLLSSQINIRDPHWTSDKIDDEIKRIQKLILEVIGTEWMGSLYHRHFISRLLTSKFRSPYDIFSLNYDLLIESSLEELQIPYTDGFCGSENAYFYPNLYDSLPSISGFFRLYKLHGSINWVRDNDGVVRRLPASSASNRERVVIYPAEQKYIQTQYGVYETLLNCFRNRLRNNKSNNKLITLGYSFNDEHINIAIQDAILCDGSNLTVYAFVGEADDYDQQKQKFSALVERCDHRFNVFIGNKECLGPAMDQQQWDIIRSLDLWKFEHMVFLLCGGAL